MDLKSLKDSMTDNQKEWFRNMLIKEIRETNDNIKQQCVFRQGSSNEEEFNVFTKNIEEMMSYTSKLFEILKDKQA